MSNKTQQVFDTFLKFQVVELQTVAYSFVIFQLQLLTTCLLMGKCLFQLKTFLEQFALHNRLTSRRNQIFFLK